MIRKRLVKKLFKNDSVDFSEKGPCKVTLVRAGKNTIDVIKAVREYGRLDLIEAKRIVDNCPRMIKCMITEQEALLIKSNVEMYGAVVQIDTEAEN